MENIGKVINKLLPLAVLVLAACYSVWPMVKCLSCVADYGRDGVLINWIMKTAANNIYGLHSGIGEDIFGGNIFYPYKYILGYSDMQYLTALWTYPVAVWWQNTAKISGLALVSGQVLTMVIIYLGWKKITKDRWAAAIAAIAFGLSQIRFEYQVHLQMWSLQYLLLAVWLVFSWWEDNRSWKLYLGAGILGLQVWESILPLYFAVLIISSGYFVMKPKMEWKKLLVAGLLFGTIASPPLLTYQKVAREFNYQRSIRDAANNSLAIDDIWKEFASPGLYILLITALWRLRSFNKDKSVRWLLWVLIFSLLLALGPVVKWGGKTVKLLGKIPIPMPYAIAYYTVPGFGAFRTPSRWIWVSGWAASGLVAIGLSKLRFSDKHTRRNLAIVAMLAVAIIGGFKVTRVKELPGDSRTPIVYKWLAAKPGKVIAILPMYPGEEEIERLPFVFVHKKKTLNGFSGFYPPERLKEAVRWTKGFPDKLVLDEMKAYGTDYVVVEKSLDYNPKAGNLRLEYEDNSHAVYKL